jgi:hypothetical protein
MKYRVVKSFPYSVDGVKVVLATANSEIDLSETMAAGLLAEGYISTSLLNKSEPPPPVEAPVEIKTERDVIKVVEGDAKKSDVVSIPEDWRTYKVAQLKSLAGLIADKDVGTVDEARKIIEAELESRKAS